MGEFGQYQLGAAEPRKSRVSPVGSPEYTEDVNNWTRRADVGPWQDRVMRRGGRAIGALTGAEGATGYDPAVWDDPVVQRHERIHVGQGRLNHRPTPAEVQSIFGATDVPGRSVVERPAYRLSQDNAYGTKDVQSQTAQAEAYINHLKTLGNSDRAISTIEVNLAPELQKRYLLNHRPPLPNPTPKELLR